nr:hypothetical protein [Tanacetum cinerariifolium]
MSQLSETTCVPKDNWKKRTASESMDEKLTKRQKRNRAEAPKIMAETLAKWTEYNKDEKAIKRKTPAKGSKKGCIKAARAMYGPSARLNLPNYSENTSSKAASSYDSIATCSYFESSEVQDSKSGLDCFTPAESKSEYNNENKLDFSKNTLSKAAATYDSAATCSYSETSEVQDLKSGLPAQSVYEESEVVNESLFMRKEKSLGEKAECNNENKLDFSEIESVYVQQDPYGVLPDFDFDFVEAGRPEECSFSLEELGLTWEPTELVL